MILALLLSIGSTPATAAPSCGGIYDNFAGAQREPTPDTRRSIDIQIAALRSLCLGWDVTDVWKTWNDRGRRQPIWHAWRKRMDTWGHLKQEELDSIACPALLDQLARLRQIPVTLEPGPLPVDPPLPKPVHPPMPPRPDGTEYTVTVLNAPQTGLRSPFINNARIAVSTSSGPVADWAVATEQALAPCWRASVS